MSVRDTITVPQVEERLREWLQTQPPALARQAESLPLRRDMATLLTFVRDSKVVGTQGIGNMPLAAIRQVTSQFVDPPRLESEVGGKTYQVRTEEDVWQLHFLHILAEVGKLIKTGRARRWRLTAKGEQFGR
jgi:hypothetical protein